MHKVITADRRSAIVGDVRGVGREYPVGEWVHRNNRMGPLLCFRTHKQADSFVEANTVYLLQVVRCEVREASHKNYGRLYHLLWRVKRDFCLAHGGVSDMIKATYLEGMISFKILESTLRGKFQASNGVILSDGLAERTAGEAQ